MQIFDKYAVLPTASITPNEPNQILSLDGFTNFLISSENAAFSEQGRSIWQDMTAPISDYYISSSHNTYLVGHQLVGVSTIEGYIRALLHSCRSVECEPLGFLETYHTHTMILLVDIYDGDEEPMVYHGKTLTSKVSLRDICNAVQKYAFVTSPYPVLISAEVHCGITQQEKLVDIMTEVFGDAIVQAPVEGRPEITVLPSPHDLQHKFLLKVNDFCSKSLRRR